MELRKLKLKEQYRSDEDDIVSEIGEFFEA